MIAEPTQNKTDSCGALDDGKLDCLAATTYSDMRHCRRSWLAPDLADGIVN
jgi:hypothetical protein